MIEIYTDGAYASSRNQGGWAFVVVQNDVKVDQNFDTQFDTTNNRMEIMASLEAMKWMKLHGVNQAVIYTDSMYVIGTMTLNWKRKKNVDLWIQMDEVSKNLNIQWTHVKGHSGNKFNELCDTFAVHASKLIINDDDKNNC